MFFEDAFCTKCNLMESVVTHVILAPGARGRGGPSSGPWRHFRGIRGIRGIQEIVPNRANYICFYSKRYSVDTPVRCFFYFSYPSHAKHLILRICLEDCLPEMLSKLGVLAERSIKKYKKHRAIAPAVLGGCGGLGQGGSGGALGGPGRALGGSIHGKNKFVYCVNNSNLFFVLKK